MTKKAALLVGMVLTLMVMGVPAQGEPNLVIEGFEFDFGIVPQNAKVSHTYTLLNGGTDTLRIDRVIPGCGCTKAPLNKSVLATGEKADLEIIFSTRKYKGTVKKSPKIMTNAGKEPRFVRFVATVTPRPDSTYPLVLKPYKLDISQFGEKVVDRKTFTIQNVSTQDITLKMVDYPTDFLEVKLPGTIAAGSEATAEIVVKSDVQDEAFDKSVTFEVDDDESTRFTIPVKRLLPKGRAAVDDIKENTVASR